MYELFAVEAPSFVNTLTEVRTGDGLIIRSSGAFSSTQLNLTPIATAVDVALRSGANLIAYSGPTVPVEQLLGDLSGLVAAFVFDAVTQTGSPGLRRLRISSTRSGRSPASPTSS